MPVFLEKLCCNLSGMMVCISSFFYSSFKSFNAVVCLCLSMSSWVAYGSIDLLQICVGLDSNSLIMLPLEDEREDRCSGWLE